MLKILVIGDQNWGKTCLVNRYVNDKFSNKIQATVTCEYSVKEIKIDHNKVRLNIWDIAGQDSLGGVSKLFCRHANAAVVVSDIVQENTLEDALQWKEKVQDYWGYIGGGHGIPTVLAVNKYDLIKNYEEEGKQELEPFMTDKYIKSFAKKHGFWGSMRVSAKTGENVEEIFEMLIDEMVNRNTKKNPMTGLQELDFKSLISGDSMILSEDQSQLSKFQLVNLKPEKQSKGKKNWCS